jgi:hypothetical protein
MGGTLQGAAMVLVAICVLLCLFFGGAIFYMKSNQMKGN